MTILTRLQSNEQKSALQFRLFSVLNTLNQFLYLTYRGISTVSDLFKPLHGMDKREGIVDGKWDTTGEYGFPMVPW